MWGATGAVLVSRSSTSAMLKQSVLDGTIGFLDADPLPRDDRDMPYFIVADDAFALRTWLMKPFSGRNLNDQLWIFNYRLSRVRRVVGNAFGILANCFRCLLITMAQEPHNVTWVVLACVTLHNIIRTRYRGNHQGLPGEEDNNHRQVPGGWRQGQVLPDLEETTRGGAVLQSQPKGRENTSCITTTTL